MTTRTQPKASPDNSAPQLDEMELRFQELREQRQRATRLFRGGDVDYFDDEVED